MTERTDRPWQLVMFDRSLKKQLKVEALLAAMGDITGQACLLVTCGDNNGAINWHFRAHGGRWAWGDVEAGSLDEMAGLLGEPVHAVPAGRFPFGEAQFDLVVAIDVLEHLPDDQPFLGEVRRVLRPSGRAVVTVPNGDPALLANRVKWRAGMTPEIYGHTRAGYTVTELEDAMRRAGLQPLTHSGYSRFFTEMVELGINYGYVFVLSRKKGARQEGQIAPTTAAQLNTHGAAYRAYALVFPLMKLVSRLDGLLSPASDNAVIVTGRKAPDGAAGQGGDPT